VAWQILISALSGFLLGFLANAAVAALPRPRFSYDAVVNDPDPRGWKFVSVDVTNKRRRGLLHFLDKTAHLCTAQIEFLDVNTRALLIDPMDARWPTFQAEPMIAGVLDVGMAVIPHRETIPPGETASVNVAVKFVGEDDFAGDSTTAATRTGGRQGAASWLQMRPCPSSCELRRQALSLARVHSGEPRRVSVELRASEAITLASRCAQLSRFVGTATEAWAWRVAPKDSPPLGSRAGGRPLPRLTTQRTASSTLACPAGRDNQQLGRISKCSAVAVCWSATVVSDPRSGRRATFRRFAGDVAAAAWRAAALSARDGAFPRRWQGAWWELSNARN
jgi:hypothetical protein